MSLNLLPSRKSRRLNYTQEKEVSADGAPATKQCPRCRRVFPRTAEYFNKDKSKPGGLKSHCKDCTRLANRKYFYQTGKYKRQQQSTQVVWHEPLAKTTRK